MRPPQTTRILSEALRSLIAPAAITAWVLLVAVAAQLQASPPATKRVVIDKTQQMLSAYEGDRLVFQSRVSTGRWSRSTPNGRFRVGVKFRMHYSSLYDNAPMPYSVQVAGNIFIHGFGVVPAWPASHGCIRLPLDGGNPAKWFFEWVEPGTPITIVGHWQGPPKSAR